MRFYTTEQIGPKRHMTPEGFLVCEEVPIARVGDMTYGPGETPISPGLDGKVYITRVEGEVFRPASIASIAGKPVADDHPPVDVDPKNWKFYTKGVVVNPRRGGEDCEDCLVADLVIYDPAMILDIDAGKREVSCGYNPDYDSAKDAQGNEIPGRGFQKNIIYNHLALVEKGRCGPRCAIGDARTTDATALADGSLRPHADELATVRTEETTMTTWRDRIKSAFGAKDADALNRALDQAEEEMGAGHHIEVHNHMPDAAEPAVTPVASGAVDDEPPWFKAHKSETEDRFRSLNAAMSELGEGLKKFFAEEAHEPEHAGGGGTGDETEEEKREEEKRAEDEKILGELEFEAPPGTNDKAVRAAKDSALLEDSFQDAVSKAEVIAPGMRMPTFDVKAAPRKTLADIQGLRRTALDLAYVQPEGRGLIDAAMSGRTVDAKTTPAQIRTLFNAVAAARGDANNRRSTDSPFERGGGLAIPGSVASIADINKRNQERYRPRKTA